MGNLFFGDQYYMRLHFDYIRYMDHTYLQNMHGKNVSIQANYSLFKIIIKKQKQCWQTIQQNYTISITGYNEYIKGAVLYIFKTLI